jgi:hypothetical protein
MKYTLELTDEQARVVQDACEAYCRMLLGQFHYAVHFAEKGCKTIDQCKALRDAAEYMNRIFTGYSSPHASHGIFNPVVHEHGKIAHDIQAVICHRRSWDQNPDGPPDGFGPVNFYEPTQAAKSPLPTITAKSD